MQKRNLKQQILALLESHHLMSVEQLLTELTATQREFNKTSVYRALDLLEETNSVCKHYFGESQAMYELQESHHAHLFCKVCGKVSEADCEVSNPEQLAGFKVDHHHLTFIGTCQNCSIYGQK